MAKIEPEFLSKNAYAKYLGIDEKAVRKAIESGKIKKGFDLVKKKIIKHLADKEFGFLHQLNRPKAGVSKQQTADSLKSEKKSELSVAKKSEVRSPKSEVEEVDLDDGIVAVPDSNKRPKIKKPPAIKQLNREPEDDEDLQIPNLVFNPRATDETVADLIQVTPYMEYKEALTKREIIGLALDKVKLQEQNKTLVRKDQVDAALYAFGAEIKKNILSIPQRCADELLHAESKVDVINILMKELNQALSALSNMNDFEIKS